MAGIEIGVFVGYGLPTEKEFLQLKKAEELGFRYVQMWAPYDEKFYEDTPQRKMMIDAVKNTDLEVTSIFAFFTGYRFWDAQLENPESREERIGRILKLSDLAKNMGIKSIQSHFCNIKFGRDDPNYRTLLMVARRIADYTAENGQQMLFHNGGEPAPVLHQFIVDMDRENVKVNFDTSPGTVEDLEELSEFVVELHLKDKKIFTPGIPLHPGTCPIGRGDVDFEKIFRKLKDMEFEGVGVIESQVHIRDWAKDVQVSRRYIENIKKRLGIE